MLTPFGAARSSATLPPALARRCVDRGQPSTRRHRGLSQRRIEQAAPPL